jgi:hypothetical protein
MMKKLIKGGRKLKIVFLAFAEPPQFAIWLENAKTNKLKTVFVTSRVGKGDWEGEANVKAVHSTLDREIKAELDRITLPVMEKLGNHFDYYESAENDRTI